MRSFTNFRKILVRYLEDKYRMPAKVLLDPIGEVRAIADEFNLVSGMAA